jgi:hypothetical protein
MKWLFIKKIRNYKHLCIAKARRFPFWKECMHPEILALIQVIWLNGSQLTYVVKKLMNYVMLAK